jgi:putative transposase
MKEGTSVYSDSDGMHTSSIATNVKTFRYRLRPSKSQRTKLVETLEICRWVYNKTLETRKTLWEKEHVTISLYETNKLLTIWKQQNPELKHVFSQVLQNAQARVDLAFKGFFRRLKIGNRPGYPRFRGYGRYDSFTFKQFGFELHNDGLFISKIGIVKIILHRPLEGQVKSLTIQRDTVGNWYACFACEVDKRPLPFNELAVGIDVGLEHFATFSSGLKVENPRFFRRDEKKLAKAQRRPSTADKNGPEWIRLRKIVQHIYQGVANRRKDFAHKLSSNLVSRFGIIAFEDLNSTDMLKNHSLAKSIADASWNQFIIYTMYKAENAGRSIVLIDPRNTSKMCSGCGTLVNKLLSERIHICPVCGLHMDRDQNAAINILRLGLESLGIALEASRLCVGNSHAPSTYL